MVKRTVFDQERVGRWVCQRLNCIYEAASSSAIGIESDGEIVGGVVFDNYRGGSVAMHVASSGGNWLTRDFLRVIFTYCFDQLGVRKVLGLVDSTNTHAQAFDENIGFVLEASIAGAGRDGDILIYTMSRAQCRFLKGQKNG